MGSARAFGSPPGPRLTRLATLPPDPANVTVEPRHHGDPWEHHHYDGCEHHPEREPSRRANYESNRNRDRHVDDPVADSRSREPVGHRTSIGPNGECGQTEPLPR